VQTDFWKTFHPFRASAQQEMIMKSRFALQRVCVEMGDFQKEMRIASRFF
jgi:hypothetical protein